MSHSWNTQKDSDKNAQQGTINNCKAIEDKVWTCLGPKAMIKMLMNQMDAIVMEEPAKGRQGAAGEARGQGC